MFDGEWITAGGNGSDVLADECLPFGALVAADQRQTKNDSALKPAGDKDTVKRCTLDTTWTVFAHKAVTGCRPATAGFVLNPEDMCNGDGE